MTKKHFSAIKESILGRKDLKDKEKGIVVCDSHKECEERKNCKGVFEQ